MSVKLIVKAGVVVAFLLIAVYGFASGIASASEMEGIVEAITEDSITVNGITYAVTLTDGQVLENMFAVGDEVEIEYVINDGRISITDYEIKNGEDDLVDA